MMNVHDFVTKTLGQIRSAVGPGDFFELQVAVDLEVGDGTQVDGKSQEILVGSAHVTFTAPLPEAGKTS